MKLAIEQEIETIAQLRNEKSHLQHDLIDEQ